jgi:hypothetical protein
MTTFHGTIAHAILEHCKVVASATGVPSNDLVRSCLSFDEPLNQAVNDKFCLAMKKEIHAITGLYNTSITNRPKAKRFSGDCYINAYAEWKQTGNDPVIGWEATFVGRFICVVPHAFNVDKDGNYYDTANNYKAKGANNRPCWVRCSGDEAKEWFARFAEYYRTGRNPPVIWTDVWGGLGAIIHTDDRVYMVRSTGLTTENTAKKHTFHKVIDCSVMEMD